MRFPIVGCDEDDLLIESDVATAFSFRQRMNINVVVGGGGAAV